MELVKATKQNNIKKVQEILRQKNIDVDFVDSNYYNWTSLHYACTNGFLEIVKLLLQDERVEVNKQDNGYTPFYIACANGKIEVVKYMMQDQRIDVNKQDNCNGTPFHAACQNSKIEVVKHMMQDQRIDINKQDNYNTTPIWAACDNNRTQIVQVILQSGRYINLDAKYQNKTPLEQAREKGYQEIANLLTEYISNPLGYFKEIFENQFQAGKLEIIQQSLKAHITTLLSLFSTYHNLTSIR